MTPYHIVLSAAGLIGLIAHATALRAVEPSQLWGMTGERWTPQSRLPDFSFAGYHRGEAPIADLPVVANVRDFGARGDGKTDDTAAFVRAIAQVQNGAILIPAGRYVINEILDIRKGNLVLRGEGSDRTTLYFPRFLNDIRPNMGATTEGQPTSNYSWAGGFIWVRGQYGGQELATITVPAHRGDISLTLSTVEGLKVGQNIDIQQRDDKDDTLATSLYAGQPEGTAQLLGRTRASLTARIVRIDSQTITIDRPLRFDIDLRWQPRIVRFEPTVKEVGIEKIRFEFPVIPYAGHFTELGHNPIAFSQVADCWVRQIAIDHCDSGIFCTSRFCTFDDIVYNSAREPDKSLRCTGHHGVYLSGDDNLFTRFRFNMRFIHDITVSQCAGNVISAGSGVDVCLDHHKRAPYANLFTDIDLGAGTRMWRCGGGADLGQHSAAWETFWSIRAQRPQTWPPAGFGPDLMNLVGLTTTQPTVRGDTGRWFEAIAPGALAPANLHEAQLKRRLAGQASGQRP